MSGSEDGLFVDSLDPSEQEEDDGLFVDSLDPVQEELESSSAEAGAGDTAIRASNAPPTPSKDASGGKFAATPPPARGSAAPRNRASVPAAHRPLLGVPEGGGPSRRAITAIELKAEGVTRAVRRAIPFLGKSGTTVSRGDAHAGLFVDLEGLTEAPRYVTHLATDPRGLRAALMFDKKLLSFVIDGMLGGNGSDMPELPATGLTGPQIALARRMSDALVRELAIALEATLGFRLTHLREVGDRPPDGTFVMLPIHFGDGGARGTLTLALARDALLTANEGPRAGPIDERVSHALEEVEIDLIAELGRIKMSLADLMGLHVGTVLRVDLAVGGAVSVRSGEEQLFSGQPTTSGTQLAIRIGEANAPPASDLAA
jgi:flagellar motor switch protein FliM